MITLAFNRKLSSYFVLATNGSNPDLSPPDEPTVLNFRHLLEEHELTNAVFEEVKSYLEQKLLLKAGSILDATIIHALCSAKNRDRKRDPEMSSTKKGNEWFFDMKAHIDIDA